MQRYELTLLREKISGEMVRLNPGTTPDMIFKTGKAVSEFHYCADNHRPPLVDISPLAQMTDLTSVRLYNCMVSDLSPLEGLYKLENIEISSMQNYLMNECRNGVILPCDFTGLQKLRSLLLVAAHCSVPKLSGLANLARIYLHGINSLEGLENQLCACAWRIPGTIPPVCTFPLKRLRRRCGVPGRVLRPVSMPLLVKLSLHRGAVRQITRQFFPLPKQAHRLENGISSPQPLNTMPSSIP